MVRISYDAKSNGRYEEGCEEQYRRGDAFATNIKTGIVQTSYVYYHGGHIVDEQQRGGNCGCRRTLLLDKLVVKETWICLEGILI